MPSLSVAELAEAGFAAYRLAQFVAIDEGPGGVFQRLRVWLGAYDYGDDGRATTGLGRGISCIHCVGVYAAIATLLLVQIEPLHWLIELLAVAGIVSLIGGLHGRT